MSLKDCPSSDEDVDIDVLEYDYHQEIVLAGYGDMLHDKERNYMYYVALKEAIEKTHAAGKKANVLDIGTGSGLLSMMAAKCGADCIYACESFVPMSLCAKEVIASNGHGDKVTVIGKKSNELTVGPGCDLPHRMNILVTEVFDTELIGEGAYSTFSHAHEFLLEKDCIVVPCSATVYAQIISSEFVKSWNTLRPFVDEVTGETLVDIPPTIENCKGIGYAHDIQLSQLSLDKFTPLTSAIPVLQFDWSGKTTVPKSRASRKHIEALASGPAHAIFVWWDLTMNESGSVTLSCAPHWAHPVHSCPSSMPWRDHWLQFIYHVSPEVSVSQGEFLSLLTIHDEFKFRFSIEHNTSTLVNSPPKDSPLMYPPPPQCNCRLHTATSHSRIGAMNDPIRRRAYLSVLRNMIGNRNSKPADLSVGDTGQKNGIQSDTVVLCLSGFSLLGVLAARLGAKKVYILEPVIFGSFVQFFIDHYNLKDQIVLLNSERDVSFIQEKVTLVMGDPFCITSVLPWEHLEDFCLLKHRFFPGLGVPTSPSDISSSSMSIMPARASFMFVPVTFDHLWKTRALVREAEGFTMQCFDDFIAKSRVFSRDQVDGHPLWEYPCCALAAPRELLSIDITQPDPPAPGHQACQAVQIERPGILHGIVIWIDWYLDQDTKISSGPLSPIDPHSTKPIVWDPYSKQGVYFMTDFDEVNDSHIVRGQVEYNARETYTQFEFSVLTQVINS
uniref:Protein arginine N-methyltransferase n=1 Tax=Cacopsylla melanoneura TaxID=428564 RepID=A0A8D9EVJ1_9HEMI